MSERLDAYASNDAYTVDGEAGIINHIFQRIGISSRVAVEFGAGDGLSWSNTARLWHDEGWKALLIEPDPGRFQDLEGNALPFDTVCQQIFLTPTGDNSITDVCAANGFTHIDLMSIDVDGDDYAIFEQMTCRPRVLCIEFNPTVPSHMAIRQKELGETFGASLLSLIRLAETRGYTFLGGSRCNAFFVVDGEAGAFAAYETDPQTLYPPELLCTYAVTDYHGRVVLVGQPLPWQSKEPYVLPLDASTNVMPITVSPQHLRRGFESLWGAAEWISSASPNGLSKKLIDVILSQNRPRLVCVDLSNEAPETRAWLLLAGKPHNYTTIVAGTVMGLVRNKEKKPVQ